jgi:hypothetical protein
VSSSLNQDDQVVREPWHSFGIFFILLLPLHRVLTSSFERLKGILKIRDF